MEIIKTKRGTTYRVRVTNGVRPISKCFKRRKDALAWQDRLRADMRAGFYPQSSFQQKMSIEMAATEWYQNRIEPRLSPKSKEAYQGSRDKYLVPLLGDCLIGSITKGHADAYLKILTEGKLKPKTLNRHLMVLKQVLKYSFEQGWIPQNPLFGFKQVTCSEQAIDFLSEAEVNSVLTCNFGQAIYPLLLLAINTGMRLGEICGLCWDQVNFKSRQLVVRRTMSSKGLRETTKTNRIRHVPMNDQVFILLERLSMQRTSDFVCLNEKGSSWDVNHSARWFRIALEKARVRKVRFHDLRHTFASHFMMNNGNIYDLQKILGHSDMKMTMKYAHLSPEHLLAASNIVSFNGGNVEDLPEIDHRNLVLLKT